MRRAKEQELLFAGPPPGSQAYIKLNSNSLIDRVTSESATLAQEFLCAVCLDLVIEPLDCRSCQNLVCAACLSSIKGECPNKCPDNNFAPVDSDLQLLMH